VATAIYAHAKGWSVVIPLQARAGGLAAAVIIGAARRAPCRKRIDT